MIIIPLSSPCLGQALLTPPITCGRQLRFLRARLLRKMPCSSIERRGRHDTFLTLTPDRSCCRRFCFTTRIRLPLITTCRGNTAKVGPFQVCPAVLHLLPLLHDGTRLVPVCLLRKCAFLFLGVFLETFRLLLGELRIHGRLLKGRHFAAVSAGGLCALERRCN
jgi:hypothetical protein